MRRPCVAARQATPGVTGGPGYGDGDAVSGRRAAVAGRRVRRRWQGEEVGGGAMVRRGGLTCGPVPSQQGARALVAAASRGHKDTVELLLDRGADLEAKKNVKLQWLLGLPCSRSAGDVRNGCIGLVL